MLSKFKKIFKDQSCRNIGKCVFSEKIKMRSYALIKETKNDFLENTYFVLFPRYIYPPELKKDSNGITILRLIITLPHAPYLYFHMKIFGEGEKSVALYFMFYILSITLCLPLALFYDNNSPNIFFKRCLLLCNFPLIFPYLIYNKNKILMI